MDVFSWCPCLGIEYPARALWCVAAASHRVVYCLFLPHRILRTLPGA